MAPRYTRREKTSLWPKAIAASVVLFPLSLNQVDFRGVFTRGVSVLADHSSPAYAALEDAREDYSLDADPAIPSGGTRLKPGLAFNPRWLAAPPVERHLELAGVTIHLPASEEHKPVMVADAKVTRLPSRRVAALAPAGSYHIDPEDDAYSIGPVAEQARELVTRELARASGERRQQILKSSGGGEILVAQGRDPRAPRGPDRELARESDRAALSFVNDFTALQLPSDALERSLALTGQIEMTGGLAFVGRETPIVVQRVYNGQTFEKGTIWPTEGKFEINVDQPLGTLVAELYTRDGRILGRGELSLLQLRDLVNKNRRVDDLRIALHPTTDIASLRAITDYTPTASAAPIREARIEIESYTDAQPVNADGIVREANLDATSTFVARASARKHWSSVIVGQAERPQDIRLFSDSLIEALINLGSSGSDQNEAREQSIVWGQITRGGEPVPGAQVEMAGLYQPIYFNEAYLPDPNLTATGKNGLFAFLKVRAGVQALRVKRANHLFPAQIFPTEEKHVSYVELELREKIVSQVRVMDMLDLGRPVQAQLRLVGGETSLRLEREAVLEYTVAGDAFMVEADAGPEFEISRVTLRGAPQMIPVPVIRREWLNQIATERGIPSSARGTIVGFVDQTGFTVEMTGYAPGETPRIVYFDAEGQVVPGSSGVAGGGFAIFNAPPGLQTVFIHPTAAREDFSQVVVAEPAFVQVLTWNPRL